MISRSWETIKVIYCHHADAEVGMQADVVFPPELLPDLTNCIHINTISGKGEYYYGSRKTGKLTFFVCDVKSEETAKKILFAIVMIMIVLLI